MRELRAFLHALTQHPIPTAECGRNVHETKAGYEAQGVTRGQAINDLDMVRYRCATICKKKGDC